MLSKFAKSIITLVAANVACGCYAHHHFTEHDSDLDNVFFGKPPASAETRRLDESQSTVYALYGLVAWSDRDTRFTAYVLKDRAKDNRVFVSALESQVGIVDVLVDFASGYVLFPIGGFLIMMRSVSVEGRTEANVDSSHRPIHEASP